jgi:hypothetical protein
MASDSPASPVSLNQLPRPYDISAAVQQALSLNSAANLSGSKQTEDCTEITIEESTECNLDEEEIEELLPELDLLEDVWNNVALPEIDKGSDNSANMEELERFCKYIGGDEEETHDEIKQEHGGLRDTRKPCSRSRKVPVQLRHNVILENAELWEQFALNGTEMVITKNGRRMFPAITISIDNLNPDDIYSIYLDILPADDRRYKFMQTEWLPVGKVDKKFNYRTYLHPESPNSGTYWMEKPISFKFLKLTNNKSTVYRDQVILNSMQKYMPTIRIACESTRTSQTFQFPETAFIAVTAYQNSKITQLKIDNNPYARAFRDSIGSEGGSANDSGSKRGGHVRSSPKQISSSPPPQLQPTSLICHAYIPPSVVCTSMCNTTSSATSIESGFESSSSSEMFNWMTNNLQQIDSPYGCPLNYWADENSLYNSALIYPPPLIDPASSFSEPYLQQTSQMHMESQEGMMSPMKSQIQRHYIANAQCYTPVKPSSFVINLNSEEDDVFA